MKTHRTYPLALALLGAVAVAAPLHAQKTSAVTRKAPLLALAQLTGSIEGITDPAALRLKAEAFRDATQSIKSCTQVPAVAKALGATIETSRDVPLTALPPALRDMVAKMPVGTATPVFGEEGKYVRTLVLCGRRGA